MTDIYFELNGLDGIEFYANDKDNLLYYDTKLNNIILFSPINSENANAEDEGIISVINSTMPDNYETLLQRLKEGNKVVSWSQVEGTTSDYIIYNDFSSDAIELLYCLLYDVKSLEGYLLDILYNAKGSKGLQYKHVEIKDNIFIKL